MNLKMEITIWYIAYTLISIKSCVNPNVNRILVLYYIIT